MHQVEAGGKTLPLWLACPGLLLFQYVVRELEWQSRFSRLNLHRFAFAYGGIWVIAIAMLPRTGRSYISSFEFS